MNHISVHPALTEFRNTQITKSRIILASLLSNNVHVAVVDIAGLLTVMNMETKEAVHKKDFECEVSSAYITEDKSLIFVVDMILLDIHVYCLNTLSSLMVIQSLDMEQLVVHKNAESPLFGVYFVSSEVEIFHLYTTEMPDLLLLEIQTENRVDHSFGFNKELSRVTNGQKDFDYRIDGQIFIVSDPMFTGVENDGYEWQMLNIMDEYYRQEVKNDMYKLRDVKYVSNDFSTNILRIIDPQHYMVDYEFIGGMKGLLVAFEIGVIAIYTIDTPLIHALFYEGFELLGGENENLLDNGVSSMVLDDNERLCTGWSTSFLSNYVTNDQSWR